MLYGMGHVTMPMNQGKNRGRMMNRYHLIKSVFGGSDVYDENGQQIGYSLPSIIGKGEDFYDMNGNPLGQSFEGAFGGMFFSGKNGSHGFLDEEFMMGQNIYMNGDVGEKREENQWYAPPPDFDVFEPQE